MSKISKASRLTGKIAIVTALTLGGGAVVSSSAFAALTTVATGSNTVEAGTLLLQQTASTTNGTTSGGIDTNISLMAPGDVVNRYIDLTRAGSLDAQSPKLTLTNAGGASPLVDQSQKGLYVMIQQCSNEYDVTDGSCANPGTETTVLANTSVYDLSSISADLSLISSLSGAESHLKVTFSINQEAANGSIEDYQETTVNGNVYDDQSSGEQSTFNANWNGGESVLGGTVNLNWVFSEELRTNTVTNG